MNISEERAQIISENNGQEILSATIDVTNFSQTTELRISQILRGDIDFSILKDKDVTNISAIYIENPGEITNLFNIPETVKILHCEEHLLVEISNLPQDIEEINFSNNSIQKFDANQLHKLTQLNLSDNELSELKNLPDSLEFLNVENNQLKQLALETAQNLKHLICSNNPILVLQRVPPSLTKIEMENNPFIEIERESEHATKQTGKKKLNYLQSIQEYFRLKNEYETAYMALKRKAFDKGNSKKDRRRRVNDVKPLCINCKRKVGSTFYHKDNYYIAKCGDEVNGCKFDISIYDGDIARLEQVISMFSQDIEEDKQQIIIDKMNSVFKYVTPQTYSTVFKEHIDSYNATSDIYKDAIDRYDLINNNAQESIAIEKKTKDIIKLKDDAVTFLDEYKKTGNRKIITSLVEMYKRDLIPAMEHLRSLKYAHMFVDIDDSDPPISKLVQHPHSIHSQDFVFGEEPKVMKFVTNL
jgi:hypothetical protein